MGLLFHIPGIQPLLVNQICWKARGCEHGNGFGPGFSDTNAAAYAQGTLAVVISIGTTPEKKLAV